MWLALVAAASAAAQALAVGGLFLVMVGIAPIFQALPVPSWLDLHRAVDARVAPVMPVLGLSVVLTALACQAFGQSPAERVLRAGPILGAVVAAGITGRVNVPINQIVAEEWRERRRSDEELLVLRGRWVRFHRYRTAASLLGTLLFLAAPAA